MRTLVGIALLCALSACDENKEPHAKPASVKIDVSTAPVVVTATLAQMFDFCRHDAAGAATKYKDNVIRFEGILKRAESGGLRFEGGVEQGFRVSLVSPPSSFVKPRDVIALRCLGKGCLGEEPLLEGCVFERVIPEQEIDAELKKTGAK
jgi:hypothetical protein